MRGSCYSKQNRTKSQQIARGGSGLQDSKWAEANADGNTRSVLKIVRPLSVDDKQKILGEILASLAADGSSYLSDGERKLLMSLYDAEDQGFTMEDLARRCYGDSAGDGQNKVRALKTRLATKVSEYFNPVSGEAVKKGLGYRFEVPKGDGGRKKLKFMLKWYALPSVIIEIAKPNSPTLTAHSAAADLFKIALLKQAKDFQFSVFSDPERFAWAQRSARESIEFMVSQDHGRGLEGRLPDTIRHLRFYPADARPELINPRLVAACANILQAPDVLVDCECIEVGALTALLSIKSKYESNFQIFAEAKSGRMQMMRLTDDDDPAFVITANAPFFLMGAGKGLGYRFVAPINQEHQVLLKRKGEPRTKIPKIVVYTRSSAYEQLLNMKLRRTQNTIWAPADPWPPKLLEIIAGAHIEPVDELDILVKHALNLDCGDMVVAWPPLSDGLMAQDRRLVEVGDGFMHWISLYCRHDHLSQADQFLWLFAHEFRNCAHYREYSSRLLRSDTGFLEFFGGGAGLKK